MFVRLRDYLHGTPWHKLEIETLRRRVLKIGARIRQTTRRIWGPSFLSLSRTTPLPPRLESPQLQLAFPSSPEKPLPTLIQAQICLKFHSPKPLRRLANPYSSQIRLSHLPIFRVGPLLESFFNTELRFLHNPGLSTFRCSGRSGDLPDQRRRPPALRRDAHRRRLCCRSQSGESQCRHAFHSDRAKWLGPAH